MYLVWKVFKNTFKLLLECFGNFSKFSWHFSYFSRAKYIFFKISRYILTSSKKNFGFPMSQSIFGVFFLQNFAECPILPSVRQKTLGKSFFSDHFFTEWPLPSVKRSFAECRWHSAKLLNPVVYIPVFSKTSTNQSTFWS